MLVLTFNAYVYHKISILIQSKTCLWLLLLSVVSNDKALRNQPLQTQTTTFLLLLTMGLPPLDFRWPFFFKLPPLKLNESPKELSNTANGSFLESFTRSPFFVPESSFIGLENDANGSLLFKLSKPDDPNPSELKGSVSAKGSFVANGSSIVKLLKESEWEFLVLCSVGGASCALALFLGGNDGVIFVLGLGRGTGVLLLMVCELHEGDTVFGTFSEILAGGTGMEEIECPLWEETGLGGGAGGGGSLGKGGGGPCGEGRSKSSEFSKQFWFRVNSSVQLLEADTFKALVGWIFTAGEDLRKEVSNGSDDLHVNGEEKSTAAGRLVSSTFPNGSLACCGPVAGVFPIISFIDFFGGALRAANKSFGDLAEVAVPMLQRSAKASFFSGADFAEAANGSSTFSGARTGSSNNEKFCCWGTAAGCCCPPNGLGVLCCLWGTGGGARPPNPP